MTVARSSGVLALALLGDALLYVALPVDAPVFGVSAGSVGVLLSANRLVRLVSYGAIARAAERLGPRRVTLIAAVAATVSTLGYGIVQGVAPLLVLRLVWGLAFGALSLTAIVYAVEDPARAGVRMGTSRALTAMGPLVALTLGPLLVVRWGSLSAFVILGGLTALAIPLAASLPRSASSDVRSPRTAPRERTAIHTRFRAGFLARRSFLTWWSFSVGFAVDGVFAVSFALLVASLVPMRTAIALTGAVLATRYVAEILLAPLAGRLADRRGAMTILRYCSLIVASGFLLMATGGTWGLWMGAATVVVARGLLLPLGPAALALSTAAFRDHSDLAAWRDLGAAVGPLVAGWAALTVPAPALHAALALLLVVAVWRRSTLSRLRPFGSAPVSLDIGRARFRVLPAVATTHTGVHDADRIPTVIPRPQDHPGPDRAHRLIATGSGRRPAG